MRGYLVDTNVLVYAYAPTDAPKRDRAAEVVGFLGSSNLGVLSPQILSEFFVVVTCKIPHPLSIAQAERSISNYLRSWRVYDLTSLIVLEAVLAVGKHGMNYWDALVWATARLYQIPVILSEDFTDRAFIQGVRFLNPFNPSFDPATLKTQV